MNRLRGVGRSVSTSIWLMSAVMSAFALFDRVSAGNSALIVLTTSRISVRVASDIGASFAIGGELGAGAFFGDVMETSVLKSRG